METGVSFPWLTVALSAYGWHEARDNARLRKFLASDGHALGDPKKLPWCGDFVETCIRKALPKERLPENPYYARNWATFGVKCHPQPGAVLVYARKNGGHVGFYVGETATHYVTLGGNQSDAVTRSRIDKRRAIACRWPATFAPPVGKPLRVDAVGVKETQNEA